MWCTYKPPKRGRFAEKKYLNCLPEQGKNGSGSNRQSKGQSTGKADDLTWHLAQTLQNSLRDGWGRETVMKLMTGRQ